ncbi:hypothetical protein GGR52DRAFT_288477 [Hypoxylon sp. FL1284]|nr:hypothetical protein GGR52DRAFT_288477 [Hypoxylon sp. FL1284]
MDVSVPESGFIEKKPFALRANPLIDVNHPDFLRMEQYFLNLLRNTRFTILEILENTFDSHEIQLFEPVASPPELARLQRDNTLRFQRLLRTRFQGRISTLQLKMAFLYFGLPVAPMKPGGYQVPGPVDLDFGEDATVFRFDPLEFLDDYTERSYGDSSKLVTSTHFSRNPPTQIFTSLGLRGGSLASGAAPVEEEQQPQQEQSQGNGTEVRIYGFQGLVLSYGLDFESFRWATDYILGARHGYTYQARIQIWDNRYIEPEPVAEKIVTLLHGKDVAGMELMRFLRKYIRQSNHYAIFVSYDLDDRPSFFQPQREGDKDNDVITLYNSGTWIGQYMRVPKNLQATYRSNQLVPQYTRTIQSYYERSSHYYLQFDSGITYGILDPPPGVWDEVIAKHAEGGDYVPEIPFTHIAIPDDYVPLLVPGYHNYDTDFSSGSRFTKDDLRIRKIENSIESITKLAEALVTAHPQLGSRGDVAIQTWMPGQDFMNTNIPGQVIETRENSITNAPMSWQLIVHNFRRLRLHARNNKLSAVVRPVYEFYQIHIADAPEYQFAIDINRVTLEEFKNSIKKYLFEEYKGDQEGEVLHLTQTTWGENKTDFAITAKTDEEGWKFITRRITEQDISVSVQNWTSNQGRCPTNVV